MSPLGACAMPPGSGSEPPPTRVSGFGYLNGIRTTSPGAPVVGWNISVAQKFPFRSKMHAVGVVKPLVHSCGAAGNLAFGSTRHTSDCPEPDTRTLATKCNVATYNMPSG